jgi:hypothetical protein
LFIAIILRHFALISPVLEPDPMKAATNRKESCRAKAVPMAALPPGNRNGAHWAPLQAHSAPLAGGWVVKDAE